MNKFLVRAGKSVQQLVQSQQAVRCFRSPNDKLLIDVDSKTGICKMKLNNPPVNILDKDMLHATVKAIKEAESSKDVRGVIISSNFDGKVFCAGLNIMDFYQQSREHVIDYWTSVQEWYLTCYGCSIPTVAVINGHSPAAGCVLSLMCDYRLMQSDGNKRIGLNETRLGIVAPFYIVEIMRSTINHRAAELHLVQGSMLSVAEALKLGLVDDIDTADNLMAKAEKQLASFMSIPPKAYHLTKLRLRHEIMDKLKAVRLNDAKEFADLVAQPSVQEDLGMAVAAMKSRKK